VSKADYYEVLGVSRDASDQELKSAYRKMAREHHPDLNPGDQAAEERFKQASEAYQVLSDADKRAAYDRYGHAGVSSAGQGFGGPFGTGVDISDLFGDLFGEMFSVGGGQRRTSRQQRGDDLRFDLTIDFEAAIFGYETDVKIRRQEPCAACNASGSASKRGPTTCGQCQGRGQVRFQQGFFSVARTCPVCGGAGQIISDPCQGRPLRRPLHPLPRILPARRPQPALRPPHQLSSGRPRRGDRDPRDRRQRHPQNSRGHAQWQGAARARQRRPLPQ
jgi:molecular chaperone DnaJ